MKNFLLWMAALVVALVLIHILEQWGLLLRLSR